MKNSVQDVPIVQIVQVAKISHFVRDDRMAVRHDKTACLSFRAKREILLGPCCKGYCRGHLWFSVQTSGGGGTNDRPVSASTIEPSAGQYIRQTVHFG